MDILEANCAAIGDKDGVLAKKILSPGLRSVQMERAKNGEWTFKHSGRYFHSTYDPGKEAASQAEEVLAKRPDFIILFGLGAGHLLKDLIGRDKDRIIVYEPSLEILKGVLSVIDMSRVFAREKVFVCNDADTLASLVKEHVEGIDELVGYQTVPYRLSFPEELKEYKTKVHNAHTMNKIVVSTGVLSYLKWIENYFDNVEAFVKYPPIDGLKDRLKGVPMVIAGAGPSLKKNAHLLKGLKGKALIVAAVTAYKPLLKYGVVPDFVIAAEKVDLPEYFTYGEDDLNTRFILGEVSHPNMFKRDVKGKFVYFNPYINLSVEQARFFGGGDYFPSSGGSVTTSAFDMGMMFGCDPIIFVGQDLSFGGGRTHVDGGVYVEQNVRIDIEKGKIVIEEEYVRPDMMMGKLSHDFDLLWLKGLDGKSIPSKYDWVTFHQWFENFMKYLKDNGYKTKVINATEGGAYIEGMEHATLKEAIERFVTAPAPIDEIIRDAEANRPPVDFKGLLDSFVSMRESIKDIGRLSKDIVRETSSAKEVLDRRGVQAGLMKSVEKIKRLEEKLFSKTGKAVFIWDSLASYTYNLKRYLRKDELNDAAGQFKRELDTIEASYKKIEETCDTFLPALNKAHDFVRSCANGQGGGKSIDVSLTGDDGTEARSVKNTVFMEHTR